MHSTIANQQLLNAIERLEDALMQGRYLEIKLSFFSNDDGVPVIDVQVDERDITGHLSSVFGDLNYESFEAALIAAGENL